MTIEQVKNGDRAPISILATLLCRTKNAAPKYDALVDRHRFNIGNALAYRVLPA